MKVPNKIISLWRCGGLALCLVPTLAACAHAPGMPPLRVVIVGGGPEPEYNPIALASNVRYVTRLLPPGTEQTTLFADGSPNHATVQYEADAPAPPVGERLLSLLLDDSGDSALRYRNPDLGCRLDGASQPAVFDRVITRLTQEPDAPVVPLLFYFTGHGGEDKNGAQNNYYEMWGKENPFTVRDMARQLARLPAPVSVTLVMVQCFSGAFGSLLFADGDPHGELLNREIAGFFAATSDRVAAGCTSEVNEADYRDFTSYFFAALTGRDRVGRQITGADFNGDGRVGMDEAFYYTLANDRSVDVPVCTSEIFLRRFLPLTDREVFRSKYSDIVRWADPAQKYALAVLAKSLHRETGEQRLALAYSTAMKNADDDSDDYDVGAQQHFDTLREEGKRRLLSRWVDLRDTRLPDYALAREKAAAWLTQQAEAGQWKSLFEADDALTRHGAEQETKEIADAHLLRFVRLGKTIVLTHRLRTGKNAALLRRFERLIAAEGRSLLPPAENVSKSNAAR